ncbi:sulfotransferase family protein [Roseivivax sp.]
MLFVIGAQKAGTTFLHQALAQTPEVHLPPVKELHYFDIRRGCGKLTFAARARELARAADALELAGPAPARLERARAAAALIAMQSGAPAGTQSPDRHAAYLTYLAEGHAGARYIADITPAYAVLPAADFADMASIGAARFVFVLRDPVARMWSQLRMATRAELGPGAPAATLAASARARAEALIRSGRLPRVERADYARTLGALDRAVPRARQHILFYEDLVRDARAFGALCDFLEIAPGAPDLGRRVNPGVNLPLPPDLESAFATAFAPQYAMVRARFGSQVPEEWR